MMPELPAMAGAYINQALLLQNEGEFDEAMNIAQLAREEFPDHILIWRMLNDIYLGQNCAAEIAAFFTSRLPSAPAEDTLDHFTLLARAERYAVNPTRALELTDAILKLSPDRLEAKFEYGLAYQHFIPVRQDCNWKSISVCLPSRFTQHPHSGKFWLEHAIESIRMQTIAGKYPIQICVGIDEGITAPDIFKNQPDVTFSNVAAGIPKNQAAAVNAAATIATGDVIAFLEDDDAYMPERLEHALLMLQKYDFTGCTQLATTPDQSNQKIFDYTNPTTWVMRHEFWRRVGPMDTSYKLHLDAEWLGRLNASGGLRVHEVDGGAPQEWHALATSRGFYKYFYSVLQPGSGVYFTPYAYPLAVKTVHAESISDMTLQNPEWQRKSNDEHMRMETKYNGRPF